VGHDRGLVEGVIRLVAVVVGGWRPVPPRDVKVEWNGDIGLVVFMVPRLTIEEPRVRCRAARATHVVEEVVVIMVVVVGHFKGLNHLVTLDDGWTWLGSVVVSWLWSFLTSRPQEWHLVVVVLL
jgi:hypothetical protein